MTSIIKYIIAAVILFCSNSVYAICIDTPAEDKARDHVSIICASQERNLELQIYTSTEGNIYVSFRTTPFSPCDVNMQYIKIPSKIINGKSVRFSGLCMADPEAKTTYSYDVPYTYAGFNYIKKQILKNKPLVITSPNSDNPFKATFDTHKYREMILDAFNANDNIHGGI